MEKRARITSKGQVTVPLEIRKLLGVQTGDDLIFEAGKSGVVVRPLRRESRFEKYRGIGNPGIGSGLEAILAEMAILRGR